MTNDVTFATFSQGDLARPEMLSDPTNYGRYLFLGAIRQIAPEVPGQLWEVSEKIYSSHRGRIPYGIKLRFTKEMGSNRPAESALPAYRRPPELSLGPTSDKSAATFIRSWCA